MPETKKAAAAPEAVEAPAESTVDVKGAILDVIRTRFENISKANATETNIATRYDYRVKLEELSAIFNEIVNLQL